MQNNQTDRFTLTLAALIGTIVLALTLPGAKVLGAQGNVSASTMVPMSAARVSVKRSV